MFRIFAVIGGAIALLVSSVAMTQDPGGQNKQVYIACISDNCVGYLWNGNTDRPTGCNSSCVGTCTWCENGGGGLKVVKVCRESEIQSTCTAVFGGQGAVDCADMFEPPCQTQNGNCRCQAPWGFPAQARCRWHCT
jgi:hypothetical protein